MLGPAGDFVRSLFKVDDARKQRQRDPSQIEVSNARGTAHRESGTSTDERARDANPLVSVVKGRAGPATENVAQVHPAPYKAVQLREQSHVVRGW